MYIAKATEVSEWQEDGNLLFDDHNGVYYYQMPSFEEYAYEDVDFIYNEDASCVLVAYDHSGADFDERVKEFYSLRGEIAEMSDYELKELTKGKEEHEEITSLEMALEYNAAPSKVVEVPEGLSDSLKDMMFNFDGNNYQLKFDCGSFSDKWTLNPISFEGEEQKLSLGEEVLLKCMNDNYDNDIINIFLSAKNYTDSTVSFEESKVYSFSARPIFSIIETVPEVILPKGLTWGSSVQDVYNLYGEPDNIMDYTDEYGDLKYLYLYYYPYGDIFRHYDIKVDMEEGITEIGISNALDEGEVIIENTDVDNAKTLEDTLSFNDAPSCIVNAPTGIPESIEEVTFLFDGKVFKMPEKISLLENDWIINEDIREKDKALDSGKSSDSYDYVSSNYDEKLKLSITAKNMSDGTVSYGDAWIRYFRCDIENCETDNIPKMILPRGITWGSSVQDVYDTYGEADKVMVNTTYVTVYYYFDQIHSKGLSLTIDYDKGLTEIFIYSDFL